jgi:Domain of unknown function (DUF4340)
MSARGTLLLLVVLAGLAGYLVLDQLAARRDLPARRDAPGTPPLLPGPPGDVTRIDLERNGRRLTVHRQDGGWALPDGGPCPPGIVAGLLETLGRVGPVMVVDPAPADPAEYGLAPPAGRLRVRGRDARVLLDLELGERNPAWTAFYARRAGSGAVVLVGSEVRWELDKLQNALSARSGLTMQTQTREPGRAPSKEDP